MLKPEGNLKAKASLVFESGYLVNLPLQIQKQELTRYQKFRIAAFQIDPESFEDFLVPSGNGALVREIKSSRTFSGSKPKSQIEGRELFLGDYSANMIKLILLVINELTV